MAKAALKNNIKEQQNGVCELSGLPLPENTSLYDADRHHPKTKGGIYLVDNAGGVDPLAHMKRHDNLRILPEPIKK